MRKRYPIAILCADLHLSLSSPICRADDNWLETQASYLRQLNRLARSWDPKKILPVICAGDIFDRWSAPPELINFALQMLPDKMLCVPGQHDLPNHRLDEMDRSGYGVLRTAEKILDLSNQIPVLLKNSEGDVTAMVFGAGWGQAAPKVEDEDSDLLRIAVIHRYCWKQGHSYPGAEESSRCSAYRKELKNYDVAVFGDNHKGFIETGECIIVNCGGFIRRKSDEVDYQPTIYTLFSDATVKPYPLDTKSDTFHEGVDTVREMPVNMREFISELERLGEHGLDFRTVVENHLRRDDVPKGVKEIILKALDSYAAGH